MRVSVCLGAVSSYSAARSRMAGIYSGIYSYSGISQTNAPLVTYVAVTLYLEHLMH